MCPSSCSGNGITHVDVGLYKAAVDGNFVLFTNYAQRLDHLLIGKNKNTILHLHLNSPSTRSKDFVKKVLRQCPLLLWQTNNDGNIPLHIAAKYDHFEIVELLIVEAKEPTQRDLETGEEEAVRRMLRSKNIEHETALHLASRGNYSSIVKEILEHEDPTYIYTANKRGESPLYIAVKNQYDDTAWEILTKFESPDGSGPKGATVFHAAAKNYFGHPRLYNLLLIKLGSFVNQADESGWTPLHVAAYEGNTLAVRIILRKDKSSAYATDKERNRTPLHMASCSGEVRVIKEIIAKCPECCEMTDGKGWNILHYAVVSRFEEAVKTITNESSLVYLLNEPDVKEYTPLDLLEGSEGSYLLNWLRSAESGVPTRLSYGDRSFILEDVKKEIQEWMKDLGEDPFGRKMVRMRKSAEREREIEERVIPELEKAKESHLVAAALVATVTFAAAFTLPGGYVSDGNDSMLKGTPILSRNTAFKAFVITDAIAMALSTSSVFIHFMLVLLGYKERYYWLIRSAFWFIVLAMGAMVVAFVTGTYAVLAPNSVEQPIAMATSIIGLTFFVLVIYVFIRLISDFIKHDRAEDRWLSTTVSPELHSTSFGCGQFNWRYLFCCDC